MRSSTREKSAIYVNIYAYCVDLDINITIKSITAWSEDDIEVSNPLKKSRMSKTNKKTKRTRAVHVSDTDENLVI